MVEAKHSITFRDKNMQEIAEVGVYSELEYEIRRNEAGDPWSFKMPMRNRSGKLQEAVEAQLDGAATGLVVRRTGSPEVVYSGDFADAYSVESGNRGDPGGLTLNGVYDWSILSGEHAWPDPTQDIGTTSLSTRAQVHDRFTGLPTEAIRRYIERNIGPTAPVARRRYPWLSLPAVVPGMGRQRQGIWKARYDQLDEFIAKIATWGGLTVDLKQRGRGGIELVQRGLAERSDLLFSREAGTLVAATLVVREPDFTEAISLGTGVEANRVVTRRLGLAGRSTVRRVLLREQTNEADLEVLQQDMAEGLEEGQSQAGAQLVVKESAGMRFGTHYNVGDVVTVRIGDREVKEPINGVTVTDSGGGVVTTPAVGSGVESLGAVAEIRKLAQDLARATRG